MKKENNKKQIDAEINRVLLNDFDKFEGFVASHWKHMFIGAVVIIIIIAVFYGVMLKKENNDRAAREKIAAAAEMQELIDVINNYSSYSEVDFARIRLAKLYEEKKDFAKAAELYKFVAQRSEFETIKSQMLLNAAYMQEKSGSVEEACNSFMTVGDNSAFSARVRAEAYYSAFRLFLNSSKKAEADSVLAKLNTLGSDDNVVAMWISFANSLAAK